MVKLTSNLDETKTQELYSLISLINNITYVAQSISLSSFLTLFCIQPYPQYQLELTSTHYALKSLNSLFIYLALGWVLPILKEAFDYIDVKEEQTLSVKTGGTSFNFNIEVNKNNEVTSFKSNKFPAPSTPVNPTPDLKKLDSASSNDSKPNCKLENDTIELISPVSKTRRNSVSFSVKSGQSITNNENNVDEKAEEIKPEEAPTPKFRRSATMGMGMLQADPEYVYYITVNLNF